MDHKRTTSKLSLKRRESLDLFPDENQPNPATSTPIRTNVRSEEEENPSLPFLLTQEMREDVDVLWDYNSPQSKPRSAVFKRSKKRLNLQQSPKVPLKRHPSNNNEQFKQDFCKLREKLKALRDELAQPDHEESLILSPREEEVFKTQTHMEEPFELEQDMFESECEDPFDDDMDEQLVMFSQQIEEKIERGGDSEVFNDSFDQVLSQIELDKPGAGKKGGFVRSYSEDVINVPCTSGKVEWHRTQSFDNYPQAQEIERKRLEAKAKLQRNLTSVIPETNSQSRCSLDEIEKKRQQARAKLEAKKQQEIIEKKKQEAIRRREENRKKNASQTKNL